MLLRFFFTFLFSYILRASAFTSQNNRPIIGIVTEELNTTIAPSAKSYMISSYVKFIESAGARVIPVWILKPKSYYEDIMSKINGVLFPGGRDLLDSDGYGRTGKLIFEIATKMNNEGDYFPLWGTCLGFELLNHLVAKKSWMTACSAEDMATNIEFVEGFKDSKLFQDLEPSLENKIINQKVVIHYHQWCFTPQNYSESGLDKYFKVLSLNRDAENMTFVSIIEAYEYPFYGVSFHPEKVPFEWVLSKTHHHIPHDLDAVQMSQYFANFFANEARKSSHRFPSKEDEDTALIYNYNPVFTGQYENNSKTQTYYFMQ